MLYFKISLYKEILSHFKELLFFIALFKELS